MSDLISRQDVLHELDGCDYELKDWQRWKLKTMVRDITSAQSEQKTGKWIQNDNGTWTCDQCQSWIPDEQHYYARYCLYCGVKMKD